MNPHDPHAVSVHHNGEKHDVALAAMRRDRDENAAWRDELAADKAILHDGLGHSFLVFLIISVLAVIGLFGFIPVRLVSGSVLALAIWGLVTTVYAAWKGGHR